MRFKRADHGETERGRDRQADEQAEHHREHEPAGAEREPQDEQHRDHGQDDVEQGAVGDRSELVVGHGDGAGEANAHAFVLGEAKLGGHLADRLGRRRARLKGVEIEDRLHADEAAELAGGRRFTRHQLAPGERRGTPGKQRVDRGREASKRRGEILGFDGALLHPLRNVGERLSETTQRGIGGERAEKRLSANELFGGVLDLVGRQEQEAVMLEEGPRRSLMHRLEMLAVIGERGSQFPGTVLGELRAGAIHHHQERVHLLRKCRIELQFALAPRQPRRDELARIGVDRKIFRGEDDSAESEQ